MGQPSCMITPCTGFFFSVYRLLSDVLVGFRHGHGYTPDEQLEGEVHKVQVRCLSLSAGLPYPYSRPYHDQGRERG